MTLENEKRFLLLLSSFDIMQNSMFAAPTKPQVLDRIAEKNWANFAEEQLKLKQNRNELVWRNDFAFIRKHLEQNGFYVSGKRNDWSITEAGKKELKRLCMQVFATNSFSMVSQNAVSHAKKLYESL